MLFNLNYMIDLPLCPQMQLALCNAQKYAMHSSARPKHCQLNSLDSSYNHKKMNMKIFSFFFCNQTSCSPFFFKQWEVFKNVPRKLFCFIFLFGTSLSSKIFLLFNSKWKLILLTQPYLVHLAESYGKVTSLFYTGLGWKVCFCNFFLFFLCS